MGLLDGYFDPEQFQASGGLLGRLLSLPQMQGLYQPSIDFDPRVSTDNGQAAGVQMSVPLAMPRPILQSNGPAVNPQTAVYQPTSDIDYRVAQSGRADVSQAVQQFPDAGNRVNAGFQSWAHAPAGNQIASLANGIPGLSSGDAGGNGDADLSGNGRAVGSSEASSIATEQPFGLSNIGYFEVPTNPNQAFSELWGIQQRNERAAVSRKDYISGVREGNVRYNPDKSLDVTNGTVVMFSYKDGTAKTVTVTGDDIAHIDAESGEVVIQKSF